MRNRIGIGLPPVIVAGFEIIVSRSVTTVMRALLKERVILRYIIRICFMGTYSRRIITIGTMGLTDASRCGRPASHRATSNNAVVAQASDYNNVNQLNPSNIQTFIVKFSVKAKELDYVVSTMWYMSVS